jgi:hypothetical protein
MKKEVKMAKSKNVLADIWAFVAWLTGIVVSLAVGSGMISGILAVAYIPEVVTETAGWVVVILTIIGALLAIIDRLSNK